MHIAIAFEESQCLHGLAHQESVPIPTALGAPVLGRSKGGKCVEKRDERQREIPNLRPCRMVLEEVSLVRVDVEMVELDLRLRPRQRAGALERRRITILVGERHRGFA